MQVLYRIGVRRRFLPIWKVYNVLGHQTEILGSSARLVLSMPDGSTMTVPGIDKHAVKVYPEIQATKLMSQGNPPPVE